jgi:hypothetical protein
MTTKIQLIAILTLTSILITSGFGVTQLAYSTGSNSGSSNSNNNNNHDNDKIEICHIPPGNPNNPQTITISKSAWAAHLSHGDHKDECDDDDEDDDNHNGGGKAGTATITLFKAVTTDNQLAPDPDFNLKIKNATKTIDVPSGSTIIVDAGTYQMSETEIDGYKFVLITGDTQCPSKLDTPFIVKGGDKIECTIYNEDKFVEGQTGGEGIIFQHNSMQVNMSDNMANDSCDNPVNSPCIEIISAENGIIGIVDSALTSDTTIVLYSVIEADRLDTTTGAINPVCSISAIVQHDKESFFLKDPFDDSFPANPTTNNVVVLKCIGMIMSAEDPDDSSKMYSPVYNVNYALIDPAI